MSEENINSGDNVKVVKEDSGIDSVGGVQEEPIATTDESFVEVDDSAIDEEEALQEESASGVEEEEDDVANQPGGNYDPNQNPELEEDKHEKKKPAHELAAEKERHSGIPTEGRTLEQLHKDRQIELEGQRQYDRKEKRENVRKNQGPNRKVESDVEEEEV